MLAAAPSHRSRSRSENGDPPHEIACPSRRHRRRRRGLQRSLPPRQARLEGRRPAGAVRAHLRLHLARGGRHAHVQLRPQRRQAPGLHAEDLQGDRGGLRAVLRHPPHRRPHARRHAGPARLPGDRPRPRPLPRTRHGVHRSARGGTEAADHGPEALRGRALRPQRRPHRPLGGDPRLRRGGPQGRRRGLPRDPRDGPRPARRRHLGRGDGEGHRARRARGERGRALGARGRADGRRGASVRADGAPVRGHRRGARDRAVRGRDAPRHRLRRGALHAPGGPGRARRHLREARTAVVRAHDPVGLRARAAARRPRPHRRQPHARLRALPGAREGRTQADHQRPLHLHPGRQPPGGAGAGGAELLGRVRRAGGLQPGGRGRPRARQLDDRRRSGHGHLGDGRRPVRRLRGARVLAGDGPPDLRHPLPGAVPQRGAPGRPPAAPHSHPRSPEGEGGGVRRRVRPGAGPVVRP